MVSFFHVDRARVLGAGQKIGLSQIDPVAEPIKEQARVFFRQRFPNGLSRHGQQYALGDYADLLAADGDTWRNTTIETIFELVRIAHFPNLVSRYESLFVCSSLADATSFRTQSANREPKYADCPIWKVQGESASKHDMNLLTLEGRVADVHHRASMYWNGDASSNPFWEHLLKLPVFVVDQLG
ncbi:MAG TPA: hypothetical protein PLC52_09390 [Anaerolineales bacterium]|nr:hypothetical protein [Anaerolineales bacterium]HRQ93063.1 hypothetical protein [Anaerolineales bacterium]